MNTDALEKLLRQAPPVRTPPTLLNELQANIDLPRTTSSTRNSKLETRNSPWLRRWMPALGFAFWFLGCVVIFGLQAGRIAELREQHRALEAAKTAAAQEAIAAQAARAAAAAELKQLKKDLADVRRLRAETRRLGEELSELKRQRAEDQQLRAGLQSGPASPIKPEQDFFALQAEHSLRMKCVNNMKQVGLASLTWASDHGDVMPPGYEAMKNELGDDKITFCPSDGTRRYRFLSPGATELDPQIVLTHCPFHNNVGQADGSVHQLGPQHRIVQRDGKWITERVGP